MKLKIKVKLFNPDCKFEFIDKGEWIDLKASEDVTLNPPFANTLNSNRKSRDVEFKSALIPLGIGMQLPKGIEAILAPRSSTFKNFGILQTNHIGIIDSSYSGPNDEWKYPVVAIRKSMPRKGDKICQFRIQLSQKATVWQKIKWLFTSKIEFEFVDDYKGVDRGGFGSTGIK